MDDDILFTGTIRADEWLCFSALSKIAQTADTSAFFQKVNYIRRALRKYYDTQVAARIVSSAYSFIDTQGNSILSAAYEAKNADIVSVASSYILAHGIENDALYNVLISPKMLMLNRQIGKLGNFNKNVKSIFAQMKSTGNSEWLRDIKTAYPFVIPAKKKAPEEKPALRTVKSKKLDVLSKFIIKLTQMKEVMVIDNSEKVKA